ncbi:tRNA 5-methylaminomethyl-2-thiouridine biosynthesis bifunctional protein MnmC [Porphyromonas crevioricanis]|uniref:tRNA 5-methylaminomethyl-2-thiouridine biosynthesis bifunctional protein MnmC n=3 Tax=Porphyromonas crevioricanis TaxID=393921 RepID=A0A2X4PPE7_9PORP|nr:tRNA U34 5-methylaminomethyl-2-thiouridine-forming methyltransferase MnmC [Porphyromonas crevioricanis]SQH73428.1 tRNA 5-methylaminomethyl-2-thiouridine biosynthesis bifunctional protein MnmC [Porphyromonas crevioricanis]
MTMSPQAEEKPFLVTTEDGSPTLYRRENKEYYHSIHGAVTESTHIFIEAGLKYHVAKLGPGCFFCSRQPLRLFELGFGTGLNALLTLAEAEKLRQRLIYYSIELHPIEVDIYEQLEYELPHSDKLLMRDYLREMHRAPWDEPIALTPYFTLHKIEGDVLRRKLPDDIDIFYMDAFSPESQSELWTLDLFKRLQQIANPGATLTTYCAKGDVRRTLLEVGFSVEKLPGPPGKRHILRATKLN